jgi:hypothetical protein
MKMYPSGMVCLDLYDVVLISFTVGNTVGVLIKFYRKRHQKLISADPIIGELKTKSPRMVLSESGQMKRPPLGVYLRGGEKWRRLTILLSVVIKNKRFAKLIKSIVEIHQKQRQLRFLAAIFSTLNRLLTNHVGLYIDATSYLDYSRFIFIAISSGTGGLLTGLLLKNSIILSVLSCATMYLRGVERISSDYNNCQILCEVAQQFHNKQVQIEMKKIIPEIQNPLIDIEVPTYICMEEKTSLVQRYRLRQLVESEKGNKRVQYFNEFIKKFPDCDPNPETIFKSIEEGKI